jgi:hypothetical protein
MDNLSLRYYKKPKNQTLKKLKRNFQKFSFKLIIPLILGLLLVGGLVYHFAFSLSPLNQEVYELESTETSTYYYSESKPFYAKIGDKNIISHKLDNKWVVNLGYIDKIQKVSFGQFNNYFVFQTFNTPNKFVNVEPKFKLTQKYKVELKDNYLTNIIDFQIPLQNFEEEVKIYNKGKLIYSLNNLSNSCIKEPLPKPQLNCKIGFNNRASEILDLTLQSSDGQVYSILNNKYVTFNGSISLNCQAPETPKIGKTIFVCNPSKDVTIAYQDKTINLIGNQSNEIEISTKEGNNKVQITGTSKDGSIIEEYLNINVEGSFYLDFAPSKEKYDIQSNYNLEFIVNTNENLKMDILANAKESTKGYKEFNSDPIDTNFNSFKLSKKDVEFNSASNSLVFQIDPSSSLNEKKEKVNPPIVNAIFSITTASAKNVIVECRIIINVSDNINDKSSCKIRYL